MTIAYLCNTLKEQIEKSIKTIMGRPKKEPTVLHSYRIKPQTADSLKAIALECGFQYGDTAAMGAFFDRLATVDPLLLKAILKSA